MNVEFTTEMKNDSEGMSKVLLKGVQRYQHLRGMSRLSGEQIVAVIFTALAFTAAIIVLRLQPREQKQWRDFLVEHFDRSIDSVKR